MNIFYDYCAFGSEMPNRSFSSGEYRYGFNGKERDNKFKGNDNSYDYGNRIYDPRCGCFLSVDPMAKDYPWYSPYQFAGNTPIWAIDRDGLEELVFQELTIMTSRGTPIINKIIWQKVVITSRAIRDKGSFWVDNTNPSGIQFSKRFLQTKLNEIQFNGDIINDNSTPLEKARSIAFKTSREQNSDSRDNTVFVNRSFVQFFNPDKGKSVNELKDINKSNDGMLDEQVDNLVSTVINADPNSMIVITGYASPIPTNISGSELETSKENNEKLAGQRAQAMADYIIKFAADNFNGIDISGNIQIVNGGIRDVSTTDEGNSKNDQRTEVVLKRSNN